MQHVKTRLFSPKWDFELLCYLTGGCLQLLLVFDILFMFLDYTNPKLCISVNAIVVVNLRKITVPRKSHLNVGFVLFKRILKKKFLYLFYFQNNLS